MFMFVTCPPSQRAFCALVPGGWCSYFAFFMTDWSCFIITLVFSAAY